MAKGKNIEEKKSNETLKEKKNKKDNLSEKTKKTKKKIKSKTSEIIENPNEVKRQKDELEKKIHNDIDILYQEILEDKTDRLLFEPLIFDSNGHGIDIHNTLLSFGIHRKKNNDSKNLKNYGKHHHDRLNFLNNYKTWVGKKVFLTDDEIKSKTPEDIDNYFAPFIEKAINYMEDNLKKGGITQDIKSLLTSSYYKEIINLPRSPYAFIKFYYLLLKRYKRQKREQELNPQKGINYPQVLNNLEMGIYEIQKIFVDATKFIEGNKTQISQNNVEDGEFLVNKIAELSPNSKIKDELSGSSLTNPLYEITDTSEFSWSKLKGGGYEVKDKTGKIIYSTATQNKKDNEISDIKLKLDTMKVKGRMNNFDRKTTEINLLHISGRFTKSDESAYEKLIRKDLASHNQIMDGKGFMIVVNNFEDGRNLFKILANELGTSETSWNEEPVFMNVGGNKNTNAQYNCIKANMKVPYKGKQIKNFFDTLNKILRNNRKLLNKLEVVRDKNKDTIDFGEVEKLLENEFKNNSDLREIYYDIRRKFGNVEYNINLEIQIFDIENYLKAEVDRSSPANHIYYEMKRFIDVFPKRFPPSIYGEENVKKAMRGLYRDYLNKIIENTDILKKAV